MLTQQMQMVSRLAMYRNIAFDKSQSVPKKRVLHTTCGFDEQSGLVCEASLYGEVAPGLVHET